MIYYRDSSSQSLLYKQRGSTLITTLVFLLVITIVSVSAVKISIFDILVAGNEQQQMVVYVSTETVLSKKVNFFTFVNKLPLYTDTPSSLTTDSVNEVDMSGNISKTKIKYSCHGLDGKGGNSLGPGANDCRVYDFWITGHKKGSGAKDLHVQGVGKEVPAAGNGSFL
jgi:hypothetical protein